MDGLFTLTVHYKEEDRIFEGEVKIMGYTHKIVMQVNGMEVLFEPDEERNYRAVLPGAENIKIKWDVDLLKAIARELETIFK